MRRRDGTAHGKDLFAWRLPQLEVGVGAVRRVDRDPVFIRGRQRVDYPAIPLAHDAHAVDIWTWNQHYKGREYRLMNPGMQPNVLWAQLERLRQAGDVVPYGFRRYFQTPRLVSDSAGRIWLFARPRTSARGRRT